MAARRGWIIVVACAAAGCEAPASMAVGSDGGPPSFSAGQKPMAGPPAHTVGGFTVTVPTMNLAPGQETTPCLIFPLVVDGPSRLVGGASLSVGPGLHHGNITTRPKTGDGVRPCPAGPDLGPVADIGSGGAVLFGSSTQHIGDEWQHFPAGMAYRVPPDQEIVARLHFLNASPNPLSVTPAYRWYTVDEASLSQELGPFAWVYDKFTIPPMSAKTITGSCSFYRPMHVVSVLPHMHRMGTRFTAGFLGGALDGTLFLDSRGYDPDNGVLTQYDPSIDLGQGDGATFSCTWQNTLDKALGYGIGDNEMCILFGYAWPPANSYTATAGDGFCLPITPK